MPEERLSSGMKAREAIERAALWWDRTGRHMTAKVGENDLVMRQVSGILRGEVFDRLRREDQLRVVRVWHYIFVRRPDVLDVKPDAPFKLGGKETVQ